MEIFIYISIYFQHHLISLYVHLKYFLSRNTTFNLFVHDENVCIGEFFDTLRYFGRLLSSEFFELFMEKKFEYNNSNIMLQVLYFRKIPLLLDLLFIFKHALFSTNFNIITRLEHK